MKNHKRAVTALLIAACLSLSGCATVRSLFGGSNRLDGFGRIPSGEFNTVVTLPEGVTIDFPELVGNMSGPQVSGSRVLIIGDSIIASTSSRYGNEMCSTLTKLGWQVAVEAQAGEFIDFAQKVVGRRLEDGWDAVVMFLGTNFDGNAKHFDESFRETIAAFGPSTLSTHVREDLDGRASRPADQRLQRLAIQLDETRAADDRSTHAFREALTRREERRLAQKASKHDARVLGGRRIWGVLWSRHDQALRDRSPPYPNLA